MAVQKSSAEIRHKRTRNRKGRLGTFVLKTFLWSVLICIVGGTLTAVGVYYFLSRDLPKISTLKNYHPPVITTVYSDDNRKIAEFYNERRKVVSLSEIPEMLVESFVAAEDARFYKHRGIDLISIVRAFFKNLEAGTIVQGGSTITQQVTKSFLLTPEKSYTRKIKEAILAYRIDKAFNKEEILYLYLNQIYLGHGAYGVEAAAENYFDKSARDRPARRRVLAFDQDDRFFGIIDKLDDRIGSHYGCLWSGHVSHCSRLKRTMCLRWCLFLIDW